MVTTPFRGEHWEVSYGIESTYGTDPGTSVITRFLGLFERGQMGDPEIDYQAIYGSGGVTARRPVRTYRGKWAMTMNISDILLLDGKALMLALGEGYTIPAATGSAYAAGDQDLSVAASAGDTTITINAAGAFSNTDFIQIGDEASDNGVASKCEVRRISSGAGTTTLTLNSPLWYAHAASGNDGNVLEINTAAAGFYYRHTIVETTTLHSITMQASFWRSSDADASPSLMRRYLGGKVARSSLRVDEGEMARLNLDEIVFSDTIHNLNVTDIQGFDAGVAQPTITLPTTEPYYFSGGTLTYDQTAIAAVRNFGLDINQNVEPRYYVAGHDPAIPRPRIALEGQREYTMNITIDPQDTTAYEELMKEGLRSGNLTGLGVLFEFQRDTPSGGTFAGLSRDKISILCPTEVVTDIIHASAYTFADPTAALQGAFARRSRMDVTGDPIINQELELTARQIRIIVLDSDSWAT